MENVYITSAVRTPIGSFQGAFSSLAAPQLGALAIKEAIVRSHLKPEDVLECIMGEVLTAGVGQAPARQAALHAGLPTSVACMTINKVCGSGLKAVMLGADAIKLNPETIVVAGGQENMTQAPHLMENSRTGYRMGSVALIDSMIICYIKQPFAGNSFTTRRQRIG
jgi:acetyl-CoA C-acetyltransferase